MRRMKMDGKDGNGWEGWKWMRRREMDEKDGNG